MQLSQSRVDLPSHKPVRSFTFSFALGIFLLVEAAILTPIFLLGYASLKEASRQFEMAFNERGKSLTLSLSTIVLNGTDKNNEKLSGVFAEIVNKEQYLDAERPITEIFILEKTGKILAHSDFTQVSTRTKEAVNELAAKYNNEFYHSALFYEANSVIQQNLPKPEGIFHGKNSFIVDSLMNDEVHYSVDFSVPLKTKETRTQKEKSYATLHVTMNHLSEYYYLSTIFKKYILILVIAFLAGIIASAITIFAFHLRAQYIQRIWREAVQLRIENDTIKSEVSSGFNTINAKLNEIEKKALLPRGAEQPSIKSEIMDAIIIEESR